MKTMICLAMALTLAATGRAGDEADPNLWLEEVEGERALAWVATQNQVATSELEAVPAFRPMYERNLEILNSAERIPWVGFRGDFLYDFWQDADHVRGIWRRTTLASYLSGSPEWELVLDLDELAAREGESWVWKGPTCLEPEGRLCMVALSRGGADAAVQREFDTRAKTFVANGFTLPEAKSRVSWLDADTLWVGTDFGSGSLTASGYPRTLREWRRGTPLAAAREIFAVAADHVVGGGFVLHNPDASYQILYDVPTAFTGRYLLRLGDRVVHLDLQDDADFQGFFKDQLLVKPRSPWTVGGRTHLPDTLLAFDLDAFLAGEREATVLFEPSERVSLQGVSQTRSHLLLTTLDNVRGRLERLTPTADGWQRETVELPGPGSATVAAASDTHDTFFFSYEDFLVPPSQWLVAPGTKPRMVRSEPAFFPAAGMTTVQYEAASADGTRIPYFVVLPDGFVADGTRPTILYGYGGFENPETPSYSALAGSAWLARGGVWALANIRGGGEFGPRWHQVAMREGRQKTHQDFIAVAEDLVRRKITAAPKLAVMGGSQGGLLVGAVVMQRPELFGAAVSQVPLLDMRRYHQLLAGASWMGEYGNPDDPADWAFIKTWSPYHLVEKGRTYPKIFFTTSTRDDRVHPGHARKMVKKMQDLGHPVYYWENTEGGHAAGADQTQRAYMWALTYAYLWKMLG